MCVLADSLTTTAQLFESEPGLCSRFYCKVAQNLANILISLNPKNNDKKPAPAPAAALPEPEAPAAGAGPSHHINHSASAPALHLSVPGQPQKDAPRRNSMSAPPVEPDDLDLDDGDMDDPDTATEVRTQP